MSLEYVVHLLGGEACLIGEDLDYYSVIVGILCERAESVLRLECDFDGFAFVSCEVFPHCLGVGPLESVGAYCGVEVHFRIDSFCARRSLVSSIAFLRAS